MSIARKIAHKAEAVKGAFKKTAGRATGSRRLRAEGLVVHTGYGHSRMRVDLAVEHPREPGRMLLAVESDGDAYAAMGSVRERDRLRPEALERLGWHHDRVWTVDLFRDPARDSSRIVALVGRLLAEENDERF